MREEIDTVRLIFGSPVPKMKRFRVREKVFLSFKSYI